MNSCGLWALLLLVAFVAAVVLSRGQGSAFAFLFIIFVIIAAVIYFAALLSGVVPA